MQRPDARPISAAHVHYARFARDRTTRTAYIYGMTKMDGKLTRTLTIELPESEWAALRSVEPDAIGWLQGRIRERLNASGESEPASRFENPGATSSETFWGADEY